MFAGTVDADASAGGWSGKQLFWVLSCGYAYENEDTCLRFMRISGSNNLFNLGGDHARRSCNEKS